MMWYSGRSKDFDQEVLQLATGQIGLATSTNGIDWTREGAVFTENKDEWYYFDTAHVGVGDVQVCPAGIVVLDYDEMGLSAREVEKLERRRSAARSERHGQLRKAIVELNSLIVSPRLKLSLS